MKSGDPTDNTEIYQDSVWRTASALPFSRLNWGVSAITLENRVLVFGKDYIIVHTNVIKYFLGGHTTNDLNNIFEFNNETEAWTEIGSMKETRRHHRLTIVSYDDYAKWCK